jgi:hypothetical protein
MIRRSPQRGGHEVARCGSVRSSAVGQRCEQTPSVMVAEDVLGHPVAV